jgi:hypothetical protein
MSIPIRATSNAPIPPALIVSLVAPPWAMAIVALHSATQLLEQLGVASEEIFRGDRLPVLHFPIGGSSAEVASPVENQTNSPV